MNLKTNARLLDLTLVLIALLSAAALFLAHEDPFARKVVCTYVRLCPVIPNAKACRKIVYDLAIGSLTSLIFYALVVRLPDYQRRQRFKKSLKRHYREFREDCILVMLMAADGTYDAALPDALMEQDKFRDYFQEKVASPGDTYYYENTILPLHGNFFAVSVRFCAFFPERNMGNYITPKVVYAST
jgi:hypothetical protein